MWKQVENKKSYALIIFFSEHEKYFKESFPELFYDIKWSNCIFTLKLVTYSLTIISAVSLISAEDFCSNPRVVDSPSKWRPWKRQIPAQHSNSAPVKPLNPLTIQVVASLSCSVTWNIGSQACHGDLTGVWRTRESSTESLKFQKSLCYRLSYLLYSEHLYEECSVCIMLCLCTSVCEEA